MKETDGLLGQLKTLFDRAKPMPGRVKAEVIIAEASFRLRAAEDGHPPVQGTMRDRLTPESYQAICEAIGAEIERLEAEIERLKRADVIIASLEATSQSTMFKPPRAAE